MSNDSFNEALSSAQLGHFYQTFTARGICHLETLAQLTMQEYSLYGVTAMDDRKRLFQLIQTIKADKADRRAPLPLQQQQQQLQITPTPLPVSNGSPRIGRRLFPQKETTNTAVSMNNNNNSSNNSNNNSSNSNNTGSMLPQPRPVSARLGRSGSPVPSEDTARLSLEPSPAPNRNPMARAPAVPNNAPVSQSALSTPISFPVQNTNNSSNPSNLSQSPGRRLNAYGVPVPGNNANTTAGVRRGVTIDANERIRVCVRKRPLNKKELGKNEGDIAVVSGRRTLIVEEPKVKVDLTKYVEQHEFTFDDVFDADCSNEEIYEFTALPLVESIFHGGKATCFAYGQTGSGKTYTMLDERNGLYVLAANDIFALLQQSEHAHLQAFVSFYEIYQGALYDLLNQRQKLFAREDAQRRVVIAGLAEHKVASVQELMAIFARGNTARTTGTTGANADSSRSHAILQIALKTTTAKGTLKTTGKFSFIDLAGSERGADRGDTDQRTRMEGSEINKSLLALKECIRALDQVSKHTPFRQSKLTQVLKDSFIGNSRTCMIATVSPNASNSEHTLNTLRYADRYCFNDVVCSFARRVKELKSASGGASQSQESMAMDEDLDDESVVNASQAIYDDPDMDNNDMLDDEFPPDAMVSTTDTDTASNIRSSRQGLQSARLQAQKTSLLSTLNAKQQSRPISAPSATPPTAHRSHPPRHQRDPSTDLDELARKRRHGASPSGAQLAQQQRLRDEIQAIGTALQTLHQMVQQSDDLLAVQAVRDQLLELIEAFKVTAGTE